MNWRKRLAAQPRLREFGQWPVIPPESLPKGRRKAYQRNRQIVAQVLSGVGLEEVARRHALSAGRISQLLERCLGGDSEAGPALTAALVPYRSVHEKHRRHPLPTLAEPSGAACAFQALLEQVPGLRAGLDATIQASLNDDPAAQRRSPSALHGEFKRCLAEAHWPQDRYPYTDESLAYEAVRRYLHQRSAERQQAHEQRHRSYVHVSDASSRPFRALRALQIDEHIVHARGRVNLKLNDELIPLALGRISILVGADVDTTCGLGYHMVPTGHPNQQDLLILLDKCVRRWQAPELVTPELSFAPGARFPSGGEGAFPISFGTVHMDNAWIHSANAIIDYLCRQCGATQALGLPAMPTIRQLIESVFDYINQHVSGRVASTTGSYPTDPARESRKNRKRPPLITYQTLDEAICVQLTERNITPVAALGGATPLALFEHQCAEHYVRYVPPMLAAQWQPLVGTVELPVHWYRHEQRGPHVNFAHSRYRGPGLLEVAAHEKRIRANFHRLDSRTLEAFSLDGEPLGPLYAPPRWQRFPHSFALRDWLHKNTRRLRLDARDPLASWLHYLLEHKDSPTLALSLLQVYTEFTGGKGGPLILEDEATAQPAVHQHRWHSSLANHRD